MVEFANGLSNYLGQLRPAVEILMWAAGGFAVLLSVIWIGINAALRARKEYLAKEKTPGEVAKESLGSVGVMANIIGIMAAAAGLLAVGVPIIYAIMVAIINGVGVFLPDVQPPF